MNFITTLAHPGHDHTYVPGGEHHHWLWIAAGAIAVGFLVATAVRRWRGR